MKRLILLSILFLFSTVAIRAQKGVSEFSIRVVDCNKPDDLNPESPKNIQANFRVNKTFGPAPLTVQFDDRSQDTAVKWRWRFGDNSGADTKNPSHTYTQEGIYTVKLTVWDADSVYSTISRADYIRAVGYGVCDSVNYDIPGNSYHLYYLSGAESGFLSGNNSRGDLAKASYFDITENKGMLMGGLFFFTNKANNFGSNPGIVFKTWDNDGPGGSPGTVLDSATIQLSNIMADDFGTGNHPGTVAFFDDWVNIDHNFYLGFETIQTPGDSLAVLTNEVSDTENGNGWEQTASGEWRTYEEGNPGYDVDNAIFPIICQPTGIDNHILEQNFIVYPIPAKDYIYVSFFDQGITEIEVSIFDLSGREVLNAGSSISSGAAINVNKLSEGLYILKISTPEGVMNRKIMIE